MILDQPGTILLSEKVRGNIPTGSIMQQGSLDNNTTINANDAFITSQSAPDYIDTKNYHNAMLNYLMVDGHVEFLAPAATVGRTNTNLAKQAGMWTIYATD